jgi:hypothetical protein
MMLECFLGWDVGAWNCDAGDSRDALVALRRESDELQLCGTPWRGNLREMLTSDEPEPLIGRLLAKCQLELTGLKRVTLAIDTPLGWPRPFQQLLSEGAHVPVPASADQNPYLFRQTELRLFQSGFRPLSAVRDMIGSQSTKGLYFLRKSGLTTVSAGVWQARIGSCQVVAIEAYPAPCRRSTSLCRLFDPLTATAEFQRFVRAGPNLRADVEDALRCGVVAAMHSVARHDLAGPHTEVPLEEGWIWVPTDCFG